MRGKQILIGGFTAIGLVVALAACGGGTAPAPVLTSIQLSSPSTSVTVGGTATFTAIAKDQNGATMTGQSVAFASSDPSKATINASGVATGVAVGATTITAKSGSVTSNAIALSVTTGGGPGAPANPATFTATATSSSQIDLSWSAVTGASSYTLERKTGAGAYAAINAPTATTYNDTGLTASTAYTYRLKAVNTSGSSSGIEATATTQSPAAGGDFTLSLNPATLSLAQGGNSTVTVTVNRTGGFTGSVTLALEGANVGSAADQVSGAFAPNPATGGSSTLTLDIGPSTATGNSTLTVRGTSGAIDKTTTLALTVTAPKTILLVDDDRSANNINPANPSAVPSVSDTTFQGLLDQIGVGYNVFVVPYEAGGPTFDQMKTYQTVIWYTGDEYGGVGNVRTVSSSDEINLGAFLDQGDRKVIVLSNSYIYGIGSPTWASINNSFFNDYIGGTGGKADVLNNQQFTTSGVTATVTDGLSLKVANNTPISTYTDVVNPKAGTDTLLTVQANPDNTSVRAVAVATGRSGVGTATSSKMIYVGLSFENIVDVGANSKKVLMEKFLAY
jgi:Bacterial Ig-like domain (group 2)